MWVIVSIFGLLLMGLGLLGVFSPGSLTRIVSVPWQSPLGLYYTIGFRLLLGVALLGAASGSRFPGVLLILGILSIIIAVVVVPILGFERLRTFVKWWMTGSSMFIRIWAFVAALFGGLLVYAVW